MPIKISYFLDRKLNLYQTPANIKNFFLERNFKEINNKDLKNLKKKKSILRIKKKIFTLINFFKKINFVFSKIDKKEIIIFDDITGEVSFIFSKEKNYFLMSPRLQNIDKIYINYSIIKFVLFNFFKRKIKLNYLIALINIIDPKIILTYIDNSQDFHTLSKFFNKKKKFLAIQNATRADYFYLNQNEKKKIFHQKLFCLGDFDVNFLNNCNISGDYEVAGSFRTSVFINKFNNNLNKNKKFDICLIGKNLVKTFQPVKIYENKVIPQYLILLENLKKYLQKKNVSLVVCCKNYGFKLEAEKYFYKDFFGSLNVTVSSNGGDMTDDNYFNSYKSILKSDVVIGLPSTLLREATYFDKKILCVDYSENLLHPFKDIALCSSKNFDDFLFKLDSLLEISSENYFKKLNYSKNYIVGEINTLEKINTLINKI